MNRRGFLSGLGALLAAPAIVPAASLMPLRGLVLRTPTIIPVSYDVYAGYFYSGDVFDSMMQLVPLRKFVVDYSSPLAIVRTDYTRRIG